MRLPLSAALAALLFLGACSSVANSRLNPFNWFGGSTEETLVLDVQEGEVIDPRPLVAQVTQMRVDPMPGGAILNAVGLPPTQGYWEAALLAENDGRPVDGVLTFQFRVMPPVTAQPAGSQPSRELTAAEFLSDQTLAGVRMIVVRGAQNQRSVRR